MTVKVLWLVVSSDVNTEFKDIAEDFNDLKSISIEEQKTWERRIVFLLFSTTSSADNDGNAAYRRHDRVAKNSEEGAAQTERKADKAEDRDRSRPEDQRCLEPQRTGHADGDCDAVSSTFL